ncbi:phosphoribosylanthranilate isomerase [Camelliibacillus cellulosilyticus]|uniref:N-(5'-phosphoribosyl)anthranilate isomerase n=1 Tax=Camelliibacillus cellulosilyticus TaxID=2174486 RepID=A0ABV9GIT0_9BACL
MILKFCGNRSLVDYKLSIQSLATHIGFLFYHGSPRFVEPHDVVDWVKKHPPRPGQMLVGVFVHPKKGDVLHAMKTVDLDILQFHGRETPDFVRDIKHETGVNVWKAIHHGPEALDKMRLFKGIADGWIIDCGVKGQWGGTGQSFDWHAVPDYLREAESQRVPCLIAGGITPENIERLLVFNPDGVDLASGIEKNGRKDAARMKAVERKVMKK